jgi:hypothetical protein
LPIPSSVLTSRATSAVVLAVQAFSLPVFAISFVEVKKEGAPARLADRTFMS